MKLPDSLEELLNQAAEKAFCENAESMIDSLLYAKLPPKLKRSVFMARLENATFEEIVATTYHLPQWPQRLKPYCPMSLTPIRKLNAFTVKQLAISIKTVRN